MISTIQPTTKNFVEFCRCLGRCDIRYNVYTTMVKFKHSQHIVGVVHTIDCITILMKSMVQIVVQSHEEFIQFAEKLGNA